MFFITLLLLSYQKEVTIDGIVYTLNDELLTASVGTSKFETASAGITSGNVVIPETVTDSGKTYTVNSISSYAFYKTDITKIEVPETIEEIGDFSFANCKKLKGKAPLVDATKYVGKNAFRDDENLQSIKFPSELETISEFAFSGCKSLKGNLIIPKNTKVIEESSFYNCKGLTGNLILSYGLQRIENNSFYGCSGFTGELIIPESVTYIGKRAFQNCSGFTGRPYIPKALERIANRTFFGCSGFDSFIFLPEGIKYIEQEAFAWCVNCKGFVTIPSSVVFIGIKAFQGCGFINGTLIFKSLELSIIPSYAFSGCVSLTGLELSSSITQIEEYAFENCKGITELILPQKITSIDVTAFQTTSISKVSYYGSPREDIQIALKTFPEEVTKIFVLSDFSSNHVGKYPIQLLPKPTPQRTLHPDPVFSKEPKSINNEIIYGVIMGVIALLIIVIILAALIVRKRASSLANESLTQSFLI